MTKENLKKKDIVFLARIIPKTGVYEVCELTIRTITDTYFVGTDKRDKHAHLLSYDDLNRIVFKNRQDALKLVQDAEKNKNNFSFETYYEEYQNKNRGSL